MKAIGHTEHSDNPYKPHVQKKKTLARKHEKPNKKLNHLSVIFNKTIKSQLFRISLITGNLPVIKKKKNDKAQLLMLFGGDGGHCNCLNSSMLLCN